MIDLLAKIHWEDILKNTGFIILKIIVILIVFWIAKKVGERFIDHTFTKVKGKKAASIGRVHTLERLTKNIFSYVLSFILIVILFGIFHFDVSALIAGAGIVGLAIGFGAQGLVSDVVTGFFLLLERQMDVGDYVTLAGYDGVVEEIGLKTTQLRGFDGTLHFVPNREISSLSNHSRGNMRALVDIGISYDENVDNALGVLQAICKRIKEENELIIEGPDVLGVQTLGSSDVVIRIIAQTVNGEQFGVEREIRKAIKEAFDEHNIEIPYPHQVYVHKKEQERDA
ncbi:mechanosensitive ion channel family protein [Scopulibacillus darangshiensis]|nr:mechanosensitive ion channel family protein [Scopulibacillus darangshiensis]